MYELNENSGYKINDEVINILNFIFLSNTWCKFVLNMYDAAGLSAHMHPSAFTLGRMCTDRSLDASAICVVLV